ncbi:MAG: glycosyltransferase family 4 protein [Desulfobacula sp.]|jgi:glycosyltransferase involved in cell wall biosynthesis
MKIFHISALPIWSMDGKGGMPSLRETLKGHIQAGYDLDIILPRYDLFSDDLKPLCIHEGDEYSIHVAPCGWLPMVKAFRNRISKISGRNSIPYPVRWAINISMFFLLTSSLLIEALNVYQQGKRKPDLVYAHNQYASLAGFLLGRLWKIPNVTRLYGTFLADLMKKPFVFFRYPTAAAGYIVPSTLLICANDGTRGDEVALKFKIPAKRFRFWQNGIDPPSKKPTTNRTDLINRFGSNLRLESKWVVSCSRLSSWKRIDRMLNALSVCRHKGLDCQLLIAGDGPEREALEQFASKLGISTDIVWFGSVAHEDIWVMMNLADVFMITNDVTNRCNPLYEAAWAGCPVVSVIDPSTSDLLRHGINALLAGKEDTETLGSYLAELLSDEDLQKKFQIEQKKLAAMFWTWEERMQVEVKELEKIVFTYKN